MYYNIQIVEYYNIDTRYEPFVNQVHTIGKQQQYLKHNNSKH